MSEIIKSMRIVKMYCWESAFINVIQSIRKSVSITGLSKNDFQNPSVFLWYRREVIQCAFRLLLDCIQTSLSHTYMSITFLMMYGTMWSLGFQINTKFFAIAYKEREI